MTGLYFLVMLILTAAGFLVGRGRAAGIAGGNFAKMHSLPAYHGLYTAALAFLAMLVVFSIGAPLVHWLAERNAMSHFSSDVGTDTLKRVYGHDVGTFDLAHALASCADAAYANRGTQLAMLRLVPTERAFPPDHIEYYAASHAAQFRAEAWELARREWVG